MTSALQSEGLDTLLDRLVSDKPLHLGLDQKTASLSHSISTKKRTQANVGS